MTTTIHKPKRDPETGEWRVTVSVDGKPVPERTYFTDDRDDAFATWSAMIAEEVTKGETREAF